MDFLKRSGRPRRSAPAKADRRDTPVSEATTRETPASEVQAPETPASERAATAPEPSDRWIGYIDHIDRTIVTGWAYDSLDMDRSVAVEAVASNGKRIGTIASKYRQDVKEAGYGTGCYGFVIDVAELRLKHETVIVRFLDSRVEITRNPFSLDPQRSLLDGRLPAAYTDAMRMLALDVKAGHAGLERRVDRA